VADDKLLETWINPLQFLEIDEPWASATPQPVTIESVLEFLTTPGIPRDVASIAERYKAISVENPRLFAVPAEDRILEKLVWPLRHAKAGYVVGNYLGTISLCGMVAEMIAILIFETNEVRMNGAIMDDSMQRLFYGSTFERLGQERRVGLLRAYGMVDADQEKAFEQVRLIRRKYLHLWSQDHESLPKDAITAYLSAVQLVTKVIGHGVAAGGKLRLTPAMERYLARTGTASSETEEP
jgi:hypothetical protein